MFEEQCVMCKSVRLIMAMMKRAVYTAVYKLLKIQSEIQVSQLVTYYNNFSALSNVVNPLIFIFSASLFICNFLFYHGLFGIP